MLDLDGLGQEKVRLITRDEFERMGAAGVFDDDEHIELLRGVLVTMGKQGEPHARITAWLGNRFVRRLDEDAFEVRQHTSYSATNDSVPEPDVQVLGRALRRRLPRTSLLLIEVSETSVRKDKELKPPIYAENRCPEYWVVDIPSQVVWVYTHPSRGRYTKSELCDASAVLRPQHVPRIEIAVRDIPWWPPGAKEPKRRRR